MTDFINRKKELANINKNIFNNTRVNIVYSFKGRGKSSLIRHAFETTNNIYYINVSSDELIGRKYAEDFYYIKLVAESICANLPISHIKKMNAKLNGNEPHVSFSLSAFFASIGFDIPKKYTALQSIIIKSIKKDRRTYALRSVKLYLVKTFHRRAWEINTYTLCTCNSNT